MSVEEKLDELILQVKILNQILITHARNELVAKNSYLSSDTLKLMQKESLRILNGELAINDEELMKDVYGDENE